MATTRLLWIDLQSISMATQSTMPAQQEASEQDIQKDAIGVTKGRKYYFKIQIQHGGSFSRIWIAVQAGSLGEAFVIADSRTLDTKFSVCDGSITEITKGEYYALISRTI